MQEGQRVGAIQSANKETVMFYGYGVYEGDHPCPKFFGIPNPRIKLDDGGIVWGCECWWGAEDKIKEKIGVREVVIVKPEAMDESVFDSAVDVDPKGFANAGK